MAFELLEIEIKMNKFFTSLSKAVAAALLFLAATSAAHAQDKGVYTLGPYSGGTNNFAATTTNTISSAVLAVSDVDNVGIQVTLAGTSSATDTVVFKFALSLDGTNYETTPSTSVSFALNGATAVTKIANVSVPSAATIKLASVENPASVALTNVTVKLRVKYPSKQDR